MKKYILSALAIASALFAGCNMSELQTSVPQTGTVKVSASLDVTKVALNGSKLVWEAGDVIGVWTGAEFTPFTVDAATVGQGAGTFTGTLPEGGAVDANSYAVFPYREGDTMEGTVYKSDLTDRNTKYALAAKPTATPNGSSVADYKFAQLTAAVKVTVKNIPAEAKFVFFESTKQLFVNEASADLSAEYPKFEVSGTGDWYFYALPEHSDVINSMDLVVPIVTGEFADPLFRFTLFSEEDWGAEFPKDPYNHKGYLNTGGYINRSDVYVLPEVNFGPAAPSYECTFDVWDNESVVTLERTDDMVLTVLKTAKFYADAEDLYVYMELDQAKQYGPTNDFNIMMDFYIDCDGNPATGGVRSDVFNHGVNWYYETFVADANQISTWNSGQYEYEGVDGDGVFSKLNNHGGEFPVETAGFYDADADYAFIEAKLSRTDFKLVNTKAAFGIAILDGTDGWEAMGKLPQNADLSMLVMDLPAYSGASAEPVLITLSADNISTNDPMQYVAVAKDCNEYGLGGSPDWFYDIEEGVVALRKAKYGLAENMFDDDPTTCFHTNTDWGAPNTTWGQRDYSINTDQWIRRRIEVALPEAKNSVKIWFQTSDSGNPAESFIIATSTNGTDFTDYGEAFGDGSFGAEYTVDVAVDGMKAFRILNTKGDASWTYCESAFGIAELKVWGE